MRGARLVLAGGFAIIFGGAVLAGSSDYPDFTFRRVKAPPPGTPPRITVQVDPEAQARRLGIAITRNVPTAAQMRAAEAQAGPAAAPGWFWRRISPALEGPRPELSQILATLHDAPPGKAVPAPRLQALSDLAARYGAEFMLASAGTRVSPALALAVAAVESSGDAEAVSKAGAQGLMQLIPATAARFSVHDPMDPAQNIRGGIAYLDWLMDAFDGDPVLVLAAYNAGEGAVRENGGVPPFAETRAYVPKVLAAWELARGLCMTPPQLLSDGCVLMVREARKDD